MEQKSPTVMNSHGHDAGAGGGQSETLGRLRILFFQL